MNNQPSYLDYISAEDFDIHDNIFEKPPIGIGNSTYPKEKLDFNEWMKYIHEQSKKEKES